MAYVNQDQSSGLVGIHDAGWKTSVTSSAGFSLLFAPDQRPHLADIQRLMASARGASFTISFAPPAPEGWAELLANGLTFDLAGLTPGSCESPEPMSCAYGFDGAHPEGPFAQVTIAPGVHLAGSENLLPVVRTLAQITKSLIGLPGLQAILWRPAHVMMEKNYFARVVGKWLDGGVFPVLGLTSLVRDASGCIRSQGLSFFTGHEVQIKPTSPQTLNAAGKFAARLVHLLIEHGRANLPDEMLGVQGERWCLDRSGDALLVRVWQKS